MSWHTTGFDDDADEGDTEAFIEKCESLLGDLDDLPDRATDFADSVREKVESMRAWVERNGRVTARMTSALENMAEGLEKWRK